jgi:Protein of unknown function (DUF2961)
MALRWQRRHTFAVLAGVGIACLVLWARRCGSVYEVSNDPGVPERPGEIGVRSLLEEMVDLTRLTELPRAPFTAHLASSYDRRSTSPSDPEGWFANDDWASLARPNYVRVEEQAGRREYVLLDTHEPGVLTRLWSATPTGVLRIYLDGNALPVIAEPLALLLSGGGTIPAPFAYEAARGYNAYFPIPYRKSCKVTVDDIVAADPFNGAPLEKFYYQIDYRSYASDQASNIRSFLRSDIARVDASLQRAAEVLAAPERSYAPRPERARVAFERDGDDLTATVTRDGGVVRELSLRATDTSDAVLHAARLEIEVDGESAVSAPLGDFFGSAPGVSDFDTLPLSVSTTGALTSRWPMPFAHEIVLRVRHAPQVAGELSVEPYAFGPRSLYFHARYRPEQQVTTQPPRDLRLADIQGQGLFVGTVFNLENPSDKWWGEGDEKMYVDGETFPSLFGTGTEDYFGYAWCTPEQFARPYHAETRAGSGGYSGRFSVNRFHVFDAIPFTKTFRFDLELWHWDRARVTWSNAVYYYARPSATDDLKAAATEP